MGEIQSPTFQRSSNASFRLDLQDSRIVSSGGSIMREHCKSMGFLRQLLLLGRQKQSWSPAVITGQIWRYLINIDMRREVLCLLKLPPYDEIVRNHPRFAFKYLAPNYLARGFTVKECASCFLHHYKFMYAALPESVLYQILKGDITLHTIAKDGNRFSLSMGSPERAGDREGELSLNMQMNDRKIFDLSFTVVPGWVVRSGAEQVVLITRLQGTSGCLPQIRLARKALHEFFPGKLLLAALQGIADAFEVCELWAISGIMQRAYSQEYFAMFKNCYDDFFAIVGMTRTTAGYYSIPIPIPNRPLTSFKGGNRSRAKKRRTMRQQIRAACAAFLLGATDRVGVSSSGVANSTLASEPSNHSSVPVPPQYRVTM